MSTNITTWIIAAAATAGVIIRPFGLPEAIWAVCGAVLLVIFGRLSIGEAGTGVAKGLDVYLFLTGMMVLAEIARGQGLFDWLAATATTWAKGSARRLFLLIYGVGTIVTVFLSNDATAVVLTPAVAAAVKAAKATKPLPYLLICAFIANAASFVLPISNPANLVIYGNHMPPLAEWLPRYSLPSLLSIVVTFLVLRWTQRQSLEQALEPRIKIPKLGEGGRTAALGIACTAVVLLVSSTRGLQLGLPTAIAGLLTAAVVLVRARQTPWLMVKDISWGVLPLVAGLFVLVEALDKTGVIQAISLQLVQHTTATGNASAWGAGVIIALASNLVNNLPAGLIAGNAVQAASVSDHVTRALLIGVDLGPNLSVTGSLATILWLTALRREGLRVSARTFLKLGVLVMPPALITAIGVAMMAP